MADPRHDSATDGDTGDDNGLGQGLDSPPATPRWVKVSGIILLVVVLLVVVLMLTGGHTPPVQHAP